VDLSSWYTYLIAGRWQNAAMNNNRTDERALQAGCKGTFSVPSYITIGAKGCVDAWLRVSHCHWQDRLVTSLQASHLHWGNVNKAKGLSTTYLYMVHACFQCQCEMAWEGACLKKHGCRLCMLRAPPFLYASDRITVSWAHT
jgi:hypothetical protein